MKIKGEFILRNVVGETVLIPVNETALEFNGMCIVNPTGTDIWRLVSEGRTKEEIISEMGAMYNVSKEVLENDVDEFILDLARAGIVDIDS